MSLGTSAPMGGRCDGRDCRRQLTRYVETVDGEFLCISCYNARGRRRADQLEGES